MCTAAIWLGAVAALHALAAQTPPDARAAIHERAAEIEERMGDVAAALNDYRQALALGTADLGLRERAAELAVRAGRRDEAIDLRTALVGATLDGGRRMCVEARLFEQLVIAGRANQAPGAARDDACAAVADDADARGAGRAVPVGATRRARSLHPSARIAGVDRSPPESARRLAVVLLAARRVGAPARPPRRSG